MGIDDERPLVERYHPIMKRMDDIVEEHRKRFGPNWADKMGLKVVKVPLTIDQDGNEVGGMDESFLRPPWRK